MRALILLCLFASACVSRAPRPTASVDPNRVTVLTYNVENLFDTEDDPEKNDDAFLPAGVKSTPVFENKCRTRNSGERNIDECLRKNWDSAYLERKLDRLTDVVEQVNGGAGPDILIVEEVESRAVLERWRNQHLKAMGYKTIVYVKGPDERGINPAILTRLPLSEPPRLHDIDYSAVEERPRPSRGILEAHLQLPDGDTLVVFAVHFPSQGAPTPFRKHAVETLMDIATTLPPGTNVLVGGDFNITAKEEHKEKYFSQKLAREFAVSHLVGCDTCAGTIYFPPDQTWSFFDVLLFSKSLASEYNPWQFRPESIRVVNSSVYQLSRFGTPARFGNGRGAVGVSDHWPLYAELHRVDPPTVPPASSTNPAYHVSDKEVH